jgi:HK97 family phage prohead protease
MKETKEQRQILLPESRPEVRRVDGEPAKIIGYAVRWDQLSHPIFGMFQERFKRGAFTSSLINPDVYAAWQHDAREVLGRTPNTLFLAEDDIGLRYEIIPPNWAERHIETIERGDVRGSSFIFRAVVDEWDESNPDMTIRTVTEAELFEVSPVTTPAYPQSSVGVRSAEDVYRDHLASRDDDDGDETPEERDMRELNEEIRNLNLLESEWC